MGARVEVLLDADDETPRLRGEVQTASGYQSASSPWLHFGQLGTHEVLHAVAQAEGWSPAEVNPAAKGARQGFWGTSEAVEGFLDQQGDSPCLQADWFDL